MVTQICTNKEQSVRLMDVGINPYTADCFLHRIMETDDWSDENVQEQIIESWMYKPGVLDIDSHYPAWSLSRLIGMLPEKITNQGKTYSLSMNKTMATYNGVDYDDYIELVSFFKKDSLFDNMINMIEWLIKDGHFNDKYLVQKGGIK